MNTKSKKWLIWIGAVIITIAAVFYQRTTGPTYPVKVEFELEGNEYAISLPRSNNGRPVCNIKLELPESFDASLKYRRYPTNDDWTISQFDRDTSLLIGTLPNLPAAGKYEYSVLITHNGETIEIGDESNDIVLRFRDDVPAWAILPHVLLIFLAMLWANATGILAASKLPFKKHLYVTIGLYFVAGLVFGPIVQKYSFGAFWTGWPFGKDLTDNKVLISFIFWIVAFVLNLKKENKWSVIVAAVIMFLIYLIPHSMRGSELDPNTGEVITGVVLLALSTKKITTNNTINLQTTKPKR